MPLTTRTILITGTHFWNPGDDFVRKGIIRALRTAIPEYDLNFLFYDFNPEDIRHARAVRFDNRVSPGELEALAPHLDAVVIAGLSAGYEVKPLYDGLLRAGLADRVLMLGAGYENDYAEGWLEDPAIQEVFRRAKVVTGRTRKHPAILDRIGVNYRHIHCPAILSVPDVKIVPSGKSLERILFSIQLPHGRGALNHTSGGGMFDLGLRTLQRLARQHDVAVVAHHKSEFVQLQDLGVEELGPLYFSTFEEDLALLYPQFDAVITTRLHAGLYANGHGLPSIVLNHTNRHTHCLEGFTHAWWVSDEVSLAERLGSMAELDLHGTADRLREFKEDLLAQYVSVLREPLSELFERGGGPTASLVPDFQLPIHFFTIVLNGEPFIRHHLPVFTQLPFEWHWHVVEGVADLKHDTAWSLNNNARIPSNLHREGRSSDGTSEYLDKVAADYPARVTLYRKPLGVFWDGKLEMVNAPVPNLPDGCLLWQVDADELWTVEQIQAVRDQFLRTPKRQAAYFWCHFFVGPAVMVTTRGAYGNQGKWEWLRVHRFRNGCRWSRHEPPKLTDRFGRQVAKRGVFTQDEMERCGAVFHHMAYATEAQVAFKESYYGYAGATVQWRQLQVSALQGCLLREHFAWVKDEARVGPCGPEGIVPLAVESSDGRWVFRTHGVSPSRTISAVSGQYSIRRLRGLVRALRGYLRLGRD